MFALAIYDKLTPGPLTGGRSIAGTGAITPDGAVGPIGGIRQKIAGADDEGATVFLVPAANCAEAAGGRSTRRRIRLVEVTEAGRRGRTRSRSWPRTPRRTVPTCR